MTGTSADRTFYFLIWAARISVSLLIISTALILDEAATESHRTDVRQEWKSRLDDQSVQLQATILQNVQTVWGLAANVSVQPDIGDERFRKLASVIYKLAPELKNIGLAPDLVIRHIYPLKGNDAALGLDLTRRSLSKAQIEMLIATGQAVYTGPIDLVQGGQGMAARIPIFVNDTGEFWGVVSVILDLNRLYDAINLDKAMPGGELALSSSVYPSDSGAIFFGSADTQWQDPVTSSMNISGVSWTLFAQPKDNWPDYPESPWANRGLLTFVVLVLILGAFWLTNLMLRDRQTQRRFRGLFELSPFGIGLYRANSRNLLNANQSFTRLFGDQGASLDYFETVYDQAGNQHPEGLGIVTRLEDHFRFSGLEGYYKGPDGALIPVLLHGLKLDNHDGEPLIWLIAEDISVRKMVDRMKSEFVSTVSHELRTPLTSISGSLGLLANNAVGELPEKASKLAQIAYRNSQQLSILINDLLDIDKLVAGKMTFQMEDLNLAECVVDCVENIASYAEEQDIRLALAPPPNIRVHADKVRLNQALNNLLSNAIKFSPEGAKVSVYVKTLGEDRVRICVQDQGEGVPENFRERIFEKFSQADGSSRRAKGGTGLGLAITRELTNRMGGSVDYDSTPGKGATFWLELPVIRPAGIKPI